MNNKAGGLLGRCKSTGAAVRPPDPTALGRPPKSYTTTAKCHRRCPRPPSERRPLRPRMTCKLLGALPCSGRAVAGEPLQLTWHASWARLAFRVANRRRKPRSPLPAALAAARRALLAAHARTKKVPRMHKAARGRCNVGLGALHRHPPRRFALCAQANSCKPSRQPPCSPRAPTHQPLAPYTARFLLAAPKIHAPSCDSRTARPTVRMAANNPGCSHPGAPVTRFWLGLVCAWATGAAAARPHTQLPVQPRLRLLGLAAAARSAASPQRLPASRSVWSCCGGAHALPRPAAPPPLVPAHRSRTELSGEHGIDIALDAQRAAARATSAVCRKAHSSTGPPTDGSDSACGAAALRTAKQYLHAVGKEAPPSQRIRLLLPTTTINLQKPGQCRLRHALRASRCPSSSPPII
jgi:hypothetical protein